MQSVARWLQVPLNSRVLRLLRFESLSCAWSGWPTSCLLTP